MNCRNCGREVSPTTQGQFCPFCGAALLPSGDAGRSSVPPAPPATSAGRQFYCAWENRATLGFVTALSQTWTESIMRPSVFFRQMPRTGGIGGPLLYAVLIGTIGGLFSLFWEYVLFDKLGTWPRWSGEMPLELSRGLLLMAVPFIPFAILLIVLLISFVYHLCLLITGSAKSGWEATLRVIAFASGPAIFLFVPVCGGLVAAGWSWILQIIGWSEAHETTTGRVLLAALLPLLVCCTLALMGIAMFANLLRGLELPTVLTEQLIRALLWR